MSSQINFILCHDQEEIRQLQRQMLIEHGFFHIKEAHSEEEIHSLLSNNAFLLIPVEKLTQDIKEKLREHKKFILLTNSSTIDHASVIELGIKNTVSFPYSSNLLIERIQNLLS